MPSLTKTNAKQHCRTCLIKINLEEEQIQTDNSFTSTETKDICVNIEKNNELKSIINKYIGNCDSLIDLDNYPQHICLGCFNKLQQTDKFLQQAKTSAEKLEELLKQKERKELNQNEFISNVETPRDIFKLMLKDTLMETETVLLDNNTMPNHISPEVFKPDPFSYNTYDVKNRETQLLDELGTEDSDNERDWAADSLSDFSMKEITKISKTVKLPSGDEKTDHIKKSELSTHSSQSNCEKRTTRLRAQIVNELEKTSSIIKKKNRRTKKEMEEFRLKQLETHKTHKTKRRQKGTKNSFKCDQCNHCFAHKITLEAHVRKIHEGHKRPFQCDKCDKSYTFIGGLYTHIKEIHDAEIRSYGCDFPNCGRTYTSFIAMQKHKRLKHSDIGEQKKYVCEQCGATFNQTGNLKYHRRTKHPTEDEKAEKEREKERYECTICKKLFHSRYTLKYHTLQLHTNDTKFECNVCGRRMAKKFMLVQHMLVHSTEKMPCEHCGKQFIRKFELEAHIRAVHMKLKPFECQFCSECFASRKTLRHHEYIHTGTKPYVCDLCGQAYRQQTCLKNHRKSHEKAGSETLLTTNINQNMLNTMLVCRSNQETTIPTLDPSLGSS